MKKLILLILVCSLLLLTVTSCLQNNKTEQTTPQDITESTTPHKTIDETTTPDKSPSPDLTTTPDNTTVIVPPKEINVGYEEVFGPPIMVFEAQPFIKDASDLASQRKLKVEVLESGIYTAKDLYDYATVVSNPTIVYPVQIASATDKDQGTMIEILEKIQNWETCYALKSTKENADKMSVYNIGGVLFIISFQENGIVKEIHYINSSDLPAHGTPPEVTTPTENVMPVPSGINPFGEGPSTFVARLFAQLGSLSWSPSLNIKVENGKIYLSDFLYESIGIINNPLVSYSDGILWALEIDKENSEVEETRKNAEKKLAVLEEIKTCTFCYVIETQTDAKFGKKIAVFYINGEYYLLNAVDEDVTRVWHVQLEQE